MKTFSQGTPREENFVDRGMIQGKKRAILRLGKTHGAYNFRVFGSVARNAATSESDVDILVDLKRGRSLMDLGALLMDLQDLLGKKVDVLTEKMLHTSIRERVLRESVPL